MNKHDQGTDWLAPTQHAIPAHAISRYSRVVSSLKLLFPIAALCILLVIMVLPNINGSNAEPKKVTATDAAMTAPVYQSRDAQNRPFEITADTARQQPNAAGLTDLQNPKAEIDLGDGKTLSGDAKGAVYNDKDGTLHLHNGLTLRHSDGATFTTQDARVDINGKDAEGDQPALLQGDFGEVRGQGFKAIDGGKIIIFKGKASAILKMGK